MPSPMKETPEKYCENCGTRLERKRLPNGDLECLIHFNKRKYCNQDCMAKHWVRTGKHRKKNILTDNQGRAIARRMNNRILNKVACEKCGSMSKKLDIHHKDSNTSNNSPENLMALCRSCHNLIHRQKGKCQICGKPVKGLGYCEKHYQRFKKWGDPMLVKINQNTPVMRSED